MGFAIGGVVSTEQLASVSMEKLHADAGRRVAVTPGIYQVDSLGSMVSQWKLGQSHLVGFVIVFAPAAWVFPDVTFLCHVGNSEVCRDLMGAQRGWCSLCWTQTSTRYSIRLFDSPVHILARHTLRPVPRSGKGVLDCFILF